MARLGSFIFLGIMIVLFVVGIVLLSYLLIFGAMVGLVLFAAVWLKEKLFPNQGIVKREQQKHPRTFDHK